MGDTRRTHVGGPLRRDGGFPYAVGRWRPVVGGVEGRRLLASVAIFVAMFGLLSASFGGVTAGVVAEDVGGRVVEVDPAGFAWRDGVRPGLIVVALTPADAPGGWSLTVRDPDGTTWTTAATAHEGPLRRSGWLAAMALMLAALAAIVIRRVPRTAGLALAVASSLAAAPMVIQGDALIAAAGIGFAAAFPLVVAGVMLGGRPGRSLVLAGSVGGLLLVAAATQDGPTFSVAVPIAAGIVVSAVLAFDELRRRGGSVRPNGLDLAVLGLAFAIGLGAILVFHLPLELVVLALAAFLLLYPRSRSRITATVDSVWLEGLRRSAKTIAVDEERARVATDLHDVPIQELTGAIARLEQVPNTEDVRAELRGVADHLRETVLGLEPPSLGVLGLGPALAQFAEGGDAGRPAVDVAVSYSDQRPPQEVERAAYRVVEEAVRNAIRHSRGHLIEVTGSIDQSTVDLLIDDDGTGFGLQEPAGHHGLNSMWHRAQAVGAALQVDGTRGGHVRFLWTKPT